MKIDKKTANYIIGIIFLLMGLKSIWALVTNFDALFQMSLISIVLWIFRIGVLVILGIYSLKQKKRGRIINVLGIIYIINIVVNTLRSTFMLISAVGVVQGIRLLAQNNSIISVIFFIAIFVYSGIINGEKLLSVQDDVSEAAKQRIQSEKQDSLYDEYVKAGLLTKEEYEQIMNTKN